MKTESLHKVIDSYLSQLKTDSDKLTQFYDACIIAKNALIEVDKKSKSMDNLIQIIADMEEKSRL